MQNSQASPYDKIHQRHAGTKPGDEIPVRVEGYERVTKGSRPGVPSGPARQASKGHATDFIPSHSDFSLPGPGYAAIPKICKTPPSYPPPDPGTKSKQCRIEVWAGDITPSHDLGLFTLKSPWVHNWIEVERCNGTRERFDVWQNADPYGVWRAEYPGTVFTEPPGFAQLGGKRSHVFKDVLKWGEWFGGRPLPVKHCVKLFDCTPALGGGWVDPPPCACVSAATAEKYTARNDYDAAFGVNSNTFVAQFLKHCKIDCPLPTGSWGEGEWSDYDFFITDYEKLVLEREREQRRRMGWPIPGEPRRGRYRRAPSSVRPSMP